MKFPAQLKYSFINWATFGRIKRGEIRRVVEAIGELRVGIAFTPAHANGNFEALVHAARQVEDDLKASNPEWKEIQQQQ